MSSKRHVCAVRLMFLGASLLTSSASTRAGTLSSDAPGNIFLEKQPLRFVVKEARGAVSPSLREYSGREVWTGSGAASVSIPAQAPGWYELSARDESGENKVSLGVLMDRNNAPLPLNGRVGVDTASAWLVTDEARRKPFARMVRLAGIPWVRERLSWKANEVVRGKIAWGKNYDNMAAAFAAEGVHVYQVWHDAPEWTRPGRENTSLAPDDLRDVYHFTRAAAAHYIGAKAWEIWNEPDIHFWPDLGDRFAGVQKAGYLGLKDGNPRLAVLNGSFAMPTNDFVRNFFANGGGDYADIYNWHRYADPMTYRDDLANHRTAARENGAGTKNWWMTEAGIALPGEGEGLHFLSDENQRKQTRFVPRAVTLALAAGNAKYFFFVLPNYVENGTQYGALKPDLTPNPGFVSLSAAANILGMSDYAGVVSAPAGVIARAFDTESGRVVVAWSETPQTLVFHARGVVTVRDMFGAASTRSTQNGRVSVEVGPDAIYISGVTPHITPPASGVLPPSVFAKNITPRVLASPSRVVLVGYTDLQFDKARDAYLVDLPSTVKSEEMFKLTVQAYNFDAKATQSGTIAPQAPAGWLVSPSQQSVKLAPMDKQVLTFTLTPSAQSEAVNRVRVVGTFAGQRVAPSVSRFAISPPGIVPLNAPRLDWTLPSLWDANRTSAAGRTLISRTLTGALRYDSTFDKPGDRWAYPRQTFAATQDFSAYDGIAFDLKVEPSAPNSVVRLMLTERGGATYMSAGVAGDTAKRRVVILFRDLSWSPADAADPNQQLDLKRILAVQLGLNTPGDAMSFEAENFELIKLAAQK